MVHEQQIEMVCHLLNQGGTHSVSNLLNFTVTGNIGRHGIDQVTEGTQPNPLFHHPILDFLNLNRFMSLDNTNCSQNPDILNPFQKTAGGQAMLQQRLNFGDTLFPRI